MIHTLAMVNIGVNYSTYVETTNFLQSLKSNRT